MPGIFTHISPCGFPVDLQTFSLVKHLFMQDSQQSMHALLQLHWHPCSLLGAAPERHMTAAGGHSTDTLQVGYVLWMPLTLQIQLVIFFSWLILFNPKVTDCMYLLPESTVTQLVEPICLCSHFQIPIFLSTTSSLCIFEIYSLNT